MNRNVSHGVARFRCMTRIYSPEKCQCPSIREAALEAAILKAIQAQIQELVDAKAVIDAARQVRSDGRASNEYLIALNRAERERKRLEDAKFRLYDNFEKGILDQDEYLRFKEKYNGEIAEQEGQIKRLQTAMAELKEARRQDDEFVSYFERYGNIDRLDREPLERLLDHVSVEDAANVHIYFKFSPEREKLLDFARNVEEETTNAAVGTL